MAGQTIVYQDFEGGADDWNYTASPSPYNVSGDVWTIVSTLSTITPSSGTAFWGMQDLDNPNGGCVCDHTLTFDPVNVSAYSSVQISFDYQTLGFDAPTDYLIYEVFEDGVGQGQVTLNPNTAANTTVTHSVTGGVTTAYLVFTAYQNGASDYAAVDNVKITGTTSGPNLSVTPSTLSGLDYVFGAGPSASQSYSLSGTSLSPASGNITVTAPANFEISTDNSTFSSGLTISYAGGNLSATTIYVRLKSGLTVATYGPVNITNAGGGATTQNVSVTGTVNAACATPSAQPTNLVFSSITTSQIDGSFTAASPAADGYLVVQSTSSSLSSSPVDATAYNPGDPLGGGTVVQSGSSTSFSATSLTTGTTYYYFVFSYNNAACSGGPKYFTTLPLQNNATTPSVPLVITEISSSGLGANFNDEYIEIANVSGSSVDLTNWTLEYYNATVLEATVNLTGTLTSGTAYVIAARNTFTGALTPDIVGNFSMNSTCYVVLKESGVIMDEAGSSGDKFTTEINFKFVNCPNDNKPTANWINLGTGDGTPGVIEGGCASIPEINVQQGVTDYLTSSTYNFGFTTVGANNDVIFTIQNTGTDNLTITTPLTVTGDYTIIAQPGSPVAPSATTTFTVRFTPSVAGTRTGSVTILNNDGDESSYVINFTGVGVSGSSASDIVENPSFVYPENINYLLDTGSNVTATSIEVMRFDIRDGGATADGDALSTILNSIDFFVTNSSQIERIALYDGATELGEVASAMNISFTGLTATATDGGTKTLSIRVTFKTTVTDNAQFSFAIVSATPDLAGSVFGSADAGGLVSSTVGDDNRLEVTATTIAWGTQPSDGFINSNLSPFTINAVDAAGNIDADESVCQVAITTSGTGMTSGSPYTFVAGSVSLNDIQYASAQTGIDVTATAQSCLGSTVIVSDTFKITSFTFFAGDYRTNPSFPTNADINFSSIALVSGIRPWQKYDGANWNDVVTAGEDLVSLATKPNNVYIFHGTEGGNTTNVDASGTYNNVIAVSGSTLILTGNTLTIASGKALTIKNGAVVEYNGGGDFTGANLTVEDGGKLILDIPVLENTDPIWAGTEDFQDNSTLVIQQFRNSGGATTRSLLNPTYQVPVNTSGLGYRFGNIVYDFNPTLADQTILPALVSPLLLCNNLTIINYSNTNYISVTANKVQSPVATIRGNVTVEQGLVSLGINYTNDAYQEVNILGNLDVQFQNPANPSKVYLHNFGGGAVTLAKMWVYIHGSINVDAGALLATGYDLNSEAHSWLYFTGTGVQNITGGGEIDISNAEINKATEHVYLYRTFPVSDSLMFTSNNFVTGSDTLRLGTATTSGVQVGGSSSSFVTTNGTGVFQRMQVITGSDYEFPIGPTVSSYNPATINYTGTVDNFSSRVEIGLNPTTGSDPSFVNRTWNISEEVAGGSNAFLSLQWEDATHENASFSQPGSEVYHYLTSWVPETFNSRGGAGPFFCKASGITTFSPFAVGSTLPVPVHEFDLRCKKGATQNELKWHSSKAAEVEYFVVERSADGIQFTKLETVFPSDKTKYETKDNNPESSNFYRVRQWINGKFELTNVVYVQNDRVNSLSIYPNPSTGHINLMIDSETDKWVEIGMYDVTGKQIVQQSSHLEKGQNQVVVDQLLSKGVYVVKISGYSVERVVVR